MKKKQNSIDWLVEEINKQKAWADPSKLEPIIQQAKAMHKDAIEDACDYGINLYINDPITSEDYYNETFGETKN